MRSLTVPPARSARAAARLRYVSDRDPGLARVRAGRGFTYRTARRRAVRDPRVLTRIRALAIPSWTSVWICPSPTGHLQAVGRDARGHKQYRYQARWRECRDENKYARLVTFGRALGRGRRDGLQVEERALLRFLEKPLLHQRSA
jgi:DNA topoisomerase IB